MSDTAQVATDAAAVAAAVSGPDTPDAVKVSRPATGAIWSLFVGLAAAILVVAGVILILWAGDWPPDRAEQRLRYLGWMGLGALACMGGVTFALMTPWVGKVSAQAGGNSVTLEGR